MITRERLQQISSYSSIAASLVSRLTSMSNETPWEAKRSVLEQLRLQITALTQEVEDLDRALSAYSSKGIEMASLELRLFLGEFAENIKTMSPSAIAFDFNEDYFRLYAASTQVAIANCILAEMQSRKLEVPAICSTILDNGGL